METDKLSKNSKFFDNTRLSSYKDCPRKYQLRHILNWSRTSTAIPLSFGSSWHSAMDAVWKVAQSENERQTRMIAQAAFEQTWEEEGLPVDLSVELVEKFSPRVPMVANDMLNHYIVTRWRMLQESEVVAIEQPFAVPLPDLTDTWYVGRLDKVVKFGGQTLVIEHKTTTAYKKDGGFLSSFTEGWDSDSQVKGYEYGGSLYFGIQQVWIDAALVHKTVHDKFRFIPVQHQKPILIEWVEDAKNWIARIASDTERNYFPKNENSCIGKYGACPFLDICRTQSAPTEGAEPPEGYEVNEWTPFDFLKLDKLIQGEQDGQ